MERCSAVVMTVTYPHGEDSQVPHHTGCIYRVETTLWPICWKITSKSCFHSLSYRVIFNFVGVSPTEIENLSKWDVGLLPCGDSFLEWSCGMCFPIVMIVVVATQLECGVTFPIPGRSQVPTSVPSSAGAQLVCGVQCIIVGIGTECGAVLL